METSLHRQLKQSYARVGSDVEVPLGGYRIDCVRDGELIEVQHGSLAAIRDKVGQLLERHRVRVVKPIIDRKRIVRQSKPDGPVTSRRWSPRRGSWLELFDELVYFTKVFPRRGLVLEVPLVEVEEWRLPPAKTRGRRRRKATYRVKDVTLLGVSETMHFMEAADLLRLLPTERLATTFDTAELATAMNVDRWVAQRIAYALRETGAARVVGRSGSGIRYTLPEGTRTPDRRSAAA